MSAIGLGFGPAMWGSCVGQLLPYVVGKTGAKGEQGRPMADAQLRRLDRYWGR